MASIASVVEEIISQRPFLQEALVKGIINYAGLSDMIKEDVEQALRKEVEHSAIMMALRRLADKLEARPVMKLRFDEECSIIVQDGLCQLGVQKNDSTMKKINSLFEKIETGKGDFLVVTHGVFESGIITHRKHLSFLKETFTDEITLIVEDLSIVTLTIPLTFMDTPGFFYTITKALAWEDINLEEIISTPKELTLCVKSDDTPRVFSVLKKLIRSG